MFYAVQLKDHEVAHHGVWAFFQAAVKREIKFKRLDVFGYVTAGQNKFVRYRTDCPDLAEDLLASGRGVIVPAPMKAGESALRSYLVRLPNGQSGTFSLATMHSVAAPGLYRVYRGTKADFWDRQFLDISGQP
jgi:hypothetical protein